MLLLQMSSSVISTNLIIYSRLCPIFLDFYAKTKNYPRKSNNKSYSYSPEYYAIYALVGSSIAPILFSLQNSVKSRTNKGLDQIKPFIHKCSNTTTKGSKKYYLI